MSPVAIKAHDDAIRAGKEPPVAHPLVVRITVRATGWLAVGEALRMLVSELGRGISRRAKGGARGYTFTIESEGL